MTARSASVFLASPRFFPMLFAAGLLLSAASLFAQAQTPAPTEPGGLARQLPPAAPVDRQAPDQNTPPGNGEAPAAEGAKPATVHPNVFEYFRVPGTAFSPRDSATGFAYDGTGCIHRTAGTGFFSAPVQLPNGATAKFNRFYYNNVVAGDAGTVYITKYDGSGGITDLAGATSTSTAGFGQSLSAEISEVIDNFAQAYVLNWIPPANANQICGARIAYYVGQTGVYTPIPPCRVFDTRVAGPQTTGSPLHNPGPHNFRIQGNCGIPNGATAVALNAAVISPSLNGDLRLFPFGGGAPVVATMNYPGGIAALANGAQIPLATVAAPTDKDLSVVIGMVGSGTIHLVIDVNGYYY